MTQASRQRARYIAADFLTISAGWLVFNLIRYVALPANTGGTTLQHWLLTAPLLFGQVAVPAGMLALYWLSGYYNQPLFKSRLNDLLNTAGIGLIATFTIYFAALTDDYIFGRMLTFHLLGYMWLCLTVPAYIARYIITYGGIRRVRRGIVTYNVLVVGTTRSAFELAGRIRKGELPNSFNVCGLVSHPGESLPATAASELPVYAFDDLPRVVAERHIDGLVIVSSRHGMQSTMELIGRLFPITGCTLYITPEMFHLITGRPRLNSVSREPLIDISHANISASTINIKRSADVAVSFAALILLSPILLAIAIAVKCDSRGPAIYRQERVGYRKKPFKILKFRTMRHDAETDGPLLSVPDDPRVTRVGRFLRKYRLDELPQFANVLVGQMSLVGPRPERAYYVEQIVARVPYYSLVHQVRPGITSWGMVKYGYASNVDEMIERLRYDLLYLDNISTGTDLRILLHTVRTVITGKGI